MLLVVLWRRREPVKVVQLHPFKQYRTTHLIPDVIPAASVFTWPFRLSMTHHKDAKKRDGKYPADWDARADRYVERLTKKKSLVFFYLNYDNPVSAEDIATHLSASHDCMALNGPGISRLETRT